MAFGVFYSLQTWRPPEAFADTPTYSPEVTAAIRTAGEAGSQAPESTGGATKADTGATDTATSSDGGNGKAGSDKALLALGAKVCANYCASCHQADGQGIPQVFPPLAGDPVVTAANPTAYINIVLHGLQGKTIKGVSYASPMPAFGDRLSNKEIAAVINHERTS